MDSLPTAELARVASTFPADTVATKCHLTAEQLRQYEEDGYLVIPGFATREQLLALQASAERILDAFDPNEFRSVFSTSKQEKLVDDYMLDSGDKVRCFFEADAFTGDGASMALRFGKNKSINKIGHGLHEKDPVFAAFSQSTPYRDLCRSLGMKRPALAQSMYIFKQPFIGGAVGAHQDSSFLYTTPQTCVGLWIALDDATPENGCMYAVKGSHKQGLRTVYCLKEEEVVVHDEGCAAAAAAAAAAADKAGGNGGGMMMSAATSAPAAAGDACACTGRTTVRKTYFTPPVADTDLKSLETNEALGTCLAVPAGSLVILHGALVHYSHKNVSDKQRHAYTLHAVDADAEWDKRNWMQRGADKPFPLLE